MKLCFVKKIETKNSRLSLEYKMNSFFQVFQELFNQKESEEIILNPKQIILTRNHSIFYISDKLNENQKIILYPKIKKAKLITIKYSNDSDGVDTYLSINFKKTI